MMRREARKCRGCARFINPRLGFSSGWDGIMKMKMKMYNSIMISRDLKTLKMEVRVLLERPLNLLRN
jgi:hypothetical protein